MCGQGSGLWCSLAPVPVHRETRVLGRVRGTHAGCDFELSVLPLGYLLSFHPTLVSVNIRKSPTTWVTTL